MVMIMIERNIVRKRLIAFIIDIFIMSMIVSLVLIGHDTRVDNKRQKELTKIINDYSSEKIDTKQYIEKYSNIIYETNQDNFDENLIYLIISVGYFLIFQYLNGGATIGKRIMKIRVVSKNKKDIKFLQLLIRVSLINEILPMVLLLFVTKLSHGVIFFIEYGIINLFENLVVIGCGLTLIFSKNNISLHDKLSNSVVVSDK